MLMAADVLLFKIAAINAVTVVPTLAPIINGAACFSVATFFATIGTTTEVVIVLDRMAAVVSTPHKNDFNGLLKKKRLKTSGDLASSKSEISFRKIRMELNSNATATTVRIKALGTLSTKKEITQLNNGQTDRVEETVSLDATNSISVIQTEKFDRKPL